MIIAIGFPIAYLAESMTAYVVSAALIGIGFACSNAPSTQMVLKFAPEGMSAISTSLDITFARLGGVVTVAMLAHVNFQASIFITTSLSLFAMIFFLMFARRTDAVQT